MTEQEDLQSLYVMSQVPLNIDFKYKSRVTRTNPVLIIEEEPMSVISLRAQLKNFGIETDYTISSSKALTIVQKRIDKVLIG